MDTVLITGSAGLIGSQAVQFFTAKGFRVVGIDNNMRQYFFGQGASTQWNMNRLQNEIPEYTHYNIDIRDEKKIEEIFLKYDKDIKLVIHAAAQPSHDWASKEPLTDFTINANGTLLLLEMTRRYVPEAVFIFNSTNKVYGDTLNAFSFIEDELRYDLPQKHPFYNGIDESMSIDQSTHSLFGASKAAADILVQEYGRYFGMKTACFRAGCLAGPYQSGAKLHGFLSYLMKCVVTGEPYQILGYKGKQLRDHIHSFDLVNAFYQFYEKPRRGEVYNVGGGRQNCCSILEAISLCEEISGQKLNFEMKNENRIGDHIWYISDVKKFQGHYPSWQPKFGLKETLEQIYKLNQSRWKTK